ncbi:glycosyltransferase family 39 protein [Candidatus Berkelbacteria bacterium]|nr:glycosyltransferase family 39 protein [Candidatus Berkelbacteria bacterium]
MDLRGKEIWIVVAAYILVNSSIYLNIGFTPDESNYIFTSEKMLEGYAPYKDYSTDVKPPLNYYVFSVLAYSGQILQLIRLLAISMNAAAALMIYMTAARMYGNRTALAAASIFLFIFTMPSFFGYAVNGDRLMILFSVASLFFFTGERKAKYIAASGMLAGLALLSKQTAVMLVLFYFICFAIERKNIAARIKPAALMAASLLIPLIIVAAHFILMGAFAEMLNWTTSEALNIRKDDTWLSEPSKFMSLETLYNFSVMSPILFLAAAFFIAFLLDRKRDMGSDMFFVIMLAVTSYPFVAVLKYMSLMAIPLSVLSARMVQRAMQAKIDGLYTKILVIFPIALIFAFSLGLNSYSVYRLHSVSSDYYTHMEDVSSYLKNAMEEGEMLYVFGYNPTIYHLSDRDPPPGMYYLYPYKEHVNDMEQARTVEILRSSSVKTAVVDNTQQSRYFNPITYKYLESEYRKRVSFGPFDVLTKE